MHIHYLLVMSMSVSVIVGVSSSEFQWNYGDHGPDVWEDTYPICSQRSQSPINIKTACTKYQSFPPFEFMNNYNVTQNFSVINNGHTIEVSQTNSSMYPMDLSGGGLDGTYSFVNFHFHWGYNYKSGSEHQINSRQYIGEIHILYEKEAAEAFAVHSIFLQLSNLSVSNLSDSTKTQERKHRKRRENSNTNQTTTNAWTVFFEAIVSLNFTDASKTINLALGQLMNTNFDNFYRYQGSLTTPPCTEDVTWTVFQTPIELSEDQIDILRSTLTTNNNRPPQPLYERTVYRSFPNDTISTISDNNCCGSDAISFFKIHNALFFISFMLYTFSFQIKD